MIKIKGKVLNVEAKDIMLRDKDSTGARTGQERQHKSVSIQLLCEEVGTKNQFVCVVRAFDNESLNVLPKVGESYETPYIRSYTNRNGIGEIYL